MLEKNRWSPHSSSVYATHMEYSSLLVNDLLIIQWRGGNFLGMASKQSCGFWLRPNAPEL